jgi:type VI protein secretion system component VasF
LEDACESIAVAPIYRLDDTEKRFAKGSELIMQQQHQKGSRRLWIWLVLLGALVALIFWLEWLGSEKPMDLTEQPVAIPQRTNFD